MKLGVIRSTAWFAAVLLAALPAFAQDIQLTSNYDEIQPPANLADVQGDQGYGPQPGCEQCGGQCNCGQCDCNPYCSDGCERPWYPAIADHCPRFGVYTFAGASSWRGVSDGTGPNNNGFFSGLNVGLPFRNLDQYGIGVQGGLSSGFYDLMGRPTNGADEANRVQQQHFVTYGLFRRADCDRPISVGVVHDWMINDNFGANSNEPTLSQFRAQVAYATSACNEFGVWATWHDRGATQGAGTNIPRTFRSVNQTNFFWHRKWCYGGADSWVWLGFPNRTRLDRVLGGTLGEIIAGGMMNVPINDRVSLFTNINYMKPSARGGVPGSREDTFDFGVGLAFYPGCTARSRTVAGRSWMPLMPVANNGNFMVDRTPQ